MINNLIIVAENYSNNTPFSLMKRILFFLAAASLVFISVCGIQSGGGSGGSRMPLRMR